MTRTTGRVQVNGREFATWRLEPVTDPRLYGAKYKVVVTPALGPQDAPNWSEVYQTVVNVILANASPN